MEALRWFRLSANNGGGAACNNLGQLYEKASLTEMVISKRATDLEEAIRLYRLGSMRGSGECMCSLGYLLASSALSALEIDARHSMSSSSYVVRQERGEEEEGEEK